MTEQGGLAALGRRAIGPIGSIARMVVGVATLGAAVLGSYGDGVQWFDALLGIVVAPGVLLAWQALRLRWTRTSLNATGPAGFALNFAIAALVFGSESTRDASMLFYGASMSLAAVRGYAGCEVLAISNWLLRRDDQVGCVVFSPLDSVERALKETVR